MQYTMSNGKNLCSLLFFLVSLQVLDLKKFTMHEKRGWNWRIYELCILSWMIFNSSPPIYFSFPPCKYFNFCLFVWCLSLPFLFYFSFLIYTFFFILSCCSCASLWPFESIGLLSWFVWTEEPLLSLIQLLMSILNFTCRLAIC